MNLQDKITALFLCVDILDYPDENFQNNIYQLSILTKQNLSYCIYDLEDLQAEHIRLFMQNSRLLDCSIFASVWLDGKMAGCSLDKIEMFYRECGFEYDADNMKKPADYLPSMISFVAILAHESLFDKIIEFSKYLDWLKQFSISLDKATTYEIYKATTNIIIEILNSFKESNV